MAKPGDQGVTIIKRKKAGGGDGHHGGAWKVAYADFVTAMMAFFLLMWLLNATTEDQRKGLAEYFDPKVPIAKISGGGAGVFAGDSVFSEDAQAKSGTGATDRRPSEENAAMGRSGAETQPERSDKTGYGMAEMENLFMGMSGESDVEDPDLRHVRTQVKDEGLIIELFDVEGQPLFAAGSAEPSPRMRALLEMVGHVASKVVNDVAIEGHTDATPFTGGGYGNWELSSDRAHAARKILVDAGVAPERIARVTGKADREPAVKDDPFSPRNRRIVIKILRSDLKR
ncbi:flagellar motor protein MotB [Oceanicella actignis]|uniref:flagellar motor protein MotB n=1 Tax=Oceanicella actignis TaxID=1189325 RepID=UPI0011E6D15A|nr:flagellar motor protein MotB [Oceanicella actignis]TYO84865.1 chemotaxis protein MotB [Oceanicella actignis]